MGPLPNQVIINSSITSNLNQEFQIFFRNLYIKIYIYKYIYISYIQISIIIYSHNLFNPINPSPGSPV